MANEKPAVKKPAVKKPAVKKPAVKKPETMADFGIRAIASLTYRGNIIANGDILGPHNCDLETAKQWLEMQPPIAEKITK